MLSIFQNMLPDGYSDQMYPYPTSISIFDTAWKEIETTTGIVSNIRIIQLKYTFKRLPTNHHRSKRTSTKISKPSPPNAGFKIISLKKMTFFNNYLDNS